MGLRTVRGAVPAVIAALLGSMITITAAAPEAEAVVPGTDVYAWGSRATSGAASGYIYGTPVRGTGTVSTGATTSSNPGGGGTLTALTASGSPVNKLSVMDAFGGGTVTVVMDSARQTTMLAGVRNTSGNYEIWRWSTTYLNPTLFWSAPAGEEIVKISSYLTASSSPVGASAVVTRSGSTTKVYTWGSNANYWTGLNSATGTTSSPTEVSGLSGVEVVDITVAHYAMLAVDASGSVWAWGDDGYGQLALATSTDQPTPVQVTNANVLGGTAPSGVVEIDAGSVGVMARTSSSVVSWGYNSTYAGHSSTTTPVALSISGCTPTSTAYSMYWSGSASYITGLIGCSGGGVRAFGANNFGQVGDNSTTTRTAPVSVSGMPSGVAVSQVVGGQGSSFARLSNGSVYGWGYNGYRVLGGTSSTTPLKTAQAATRVVHPSSGTWTRMFALYAGAGILDSTGVVYTWGAAPYGIVGRGTKGPASTTTGSDFARIGATPGARIKLADSTDRGTVIVMSDESIWTWGVNNGDWNNGDGGSGNRLWPGKIDLPYGPGTSAPTETTERLACGTNHCLVATSEGRIFGWGDQSYKQILPTAATAASYYRSPTFVVDLATVPRLAAGKWFSLYVEPGTGGTVKGWGYNNGRAASTTGAATTLTAFTESISETNVVDVAAGFSHSVGLLSDGSVVVWGLNTSYQHGDGSKTTPVSYRTSLSFSGQSAIGIHATGYGTFARMGSGLLYAWGTNSYGFLGSGSTAAVTTPRSVATSVTATARITSIDAIVQSETTTYMSTTVAVDENGKVWTWGANGFGQLGANLTSVTTGASSYRATPQAVLTSTSAAVGSQLGGVTRAVVGPGWGMAYTPSGSAQAPSEPRSVSATAGNTSASISWSAPTTPRDLRSYTVVARSADLSTIVSRTSVASSTTTATVSGLTNGTTYSFTVYASNEFGDSVESSPAVTATPVAVPSAPRNLVATTATTSVTVAFDAPSSDGGSPLTSYSVVTTNNANSADTQTASVSPSGTLQTVVTGLTEGTSYSISVRAINAQGQSIPVTDSVVIAGRPTEPRDVVVESRVSSAEVSWSAPVSDGGQPIVSYYVRAYATGTSTVAASAIVPASTTSTTLTGLTDGSTYDVTVAAAQDTATLPSVPTRLGAESDREAVVVGRPSAPTSVTAARGNASATVSWSAVPDVTGITVTGYTVRYVTGSTTATTSATCAGSTCSTTVTGLTNGSEYTVSVAASSASGLGPYSDTATVTPATTPGTPRNLAVSIGDSSADVTWDEPTSNGGSEVTSYVVTVTEGATTVATVTVEKGSAVSAPTTATVSGLTNGTSYTFAVHAVNSVGAGTAASSTGTPIGPPSEPRDLVLTPGTTSFTASWTAPESDGGAAVSSYTVTIEADGVVTTFTTAGSGSCVTSTRTCSVTQVDDGTDSGTLTAVTTDTPYTVSVVATNSAGDGKPTADVVVITGQPSAPRTVVATAANASFEVCLTAPATVPTGSIQYYRISTTTDGTSYDRLVTQASAWASSATCTGAGRIGYTVSALDSGSAPVNGSEYDVTVAATVSTATDPDERVYGMESTSTTVTPKTTPGAVATVSAAASGDGAVTVSWTAPTSTGGSPITGYSLRYREASGAWQTYTTTTLTGSSTSATVTGLTAGATHTFEVTPANVVGAGVASTTTERAITRPVPATITAPTSSTVVTSLVVEFTYVTSTAAPVASASVVATPSSGSATSQPVNLGADCSLGSCTVTLNSLANSTYTVDVLLTNAAGSTSTSALSVVLLAPTTGGGGGSSEPAPSPTPSPSTPEAPSNDDDRTVTNPGDLDDGCTLRSLCDGWSSDDGEVRGGDGRELTPIPDDRLGEIPSTIEDPVLIRGDVPQTQSANQGASTVALTWPAPQDGSTAGYLLQLRQLGSQRWTTFEVASPTAIVDVTARGYVFEARVLRNSDFSMVSLNTRFGAALTGRQTVTFSGQELVAQQPEVSVVEDPAAYGGQVLLLTGSSTFAQFSVRGETVTIWHPVGPALGTADVLVNGVVRATLDQQAAAAGRASTTLSGLGRGTKWITVVTRAGAHEAVAVDAIGPGRQCGASCQVNPRPLTVTTRDGVPPRLKRLLATSGGRATGVAFTASAVSLTLEGRSDAVLFILDGRVVPASRLRITGSTVTFKGLAARPHVLAVVPTGRAMRISSAQAAARL